MTPAQKLERFTNRAEYYARSRPGYADRVIDILREAAGWTPDATIADIGAGTGISSELFLRHGNSVIAIEPNVEMRTSAGALLATYPHFVVLDGRAEATGLPDASMDYVVAATAFHWFDPTQTRKEWARILKPGGYVILMWNERRSQTSPFLRAYDEMLREFSPDYKQNWSTERKSVVHHMAAFYDGPHEERRFENPQMLDWDHLHDRVLSSSYAPLPGDTNYAPMIARLRELFDAFQSDGNVVIEYETALFWGHLPASTSR